MPRAWGGTVHGTQVDAAAHFDFLHLGESELTDTIDSRNGFVYVLLMVEDICNYVWLRPVRTCTARFTAMKLINCCSSFEPPTM